MDRFLRAAEGLFLGLVYLSGWVSITCLAFNSEPNKCFESRIEAVISLGRDQP